MPSDVSQRVRMARVRKSTTLMIGAVGAFCVVFSISLLGHIFSYTFGVGMQNNGWVDEGAVITLGQRVAYFCAWAVVMCLAWFAFFAAFRVLISLRSGAFFAVETCRRLQTFGASLVAVIIADFFLGLVQVPIITWANADGGRALALSVDNGDITIGLCGVGFLVIGWVFSEGALIAEENKGFV